MENEERTYTIDTTGRKHLIQMAVQAVADMLRHPRCLAPTSIDLWTQYVSGSDLLTLADAYGVPIALLPTYASITVPILDNPQIDFRITQYVHSKDLSDQDREAYETHNRECCADPEATQPQPMTAGYL